MVKNPPSDAGNGGLIPDWGTNIAHMVRQLRQHTAARKARALQRGTTCHSGGRSSPN